MKKLCFLLALFLLLTACGGPAASVPSPEVPASAPAASPTPEAAPTARPAQTPSPGPAPLTEAEVEAAKEAALAYYAETVFEVRELTFLPPRRGPLLLGGRGGLPGGLRQRRPGAGAPHHRPVPAGRGVDRHQGRVLK